MERLKGKVKYLLKALSGVTNTLILNYHVKEIDLHSHKFVYSNVYAHVHASYGNLHQIYHIAITTYPTHL